MTPPLFLIDSLGPGPVVELRGPEARHAGTVVRLTPGEPALLSDGHGALAEVVVKSVERDCILFAVEDFRVVPPRNPRLVVVQAVPKGDRAELAVELMTELGVDEIVPWAASRSVSQWRTDDKVARALEKWRRTAREATKQSRRPRLPGIGPLASTGDVAGRIATASSAFVLHEAAISPLAGWVLPEHGEVLVVVGPEGGLADAEIEAFTESGASAVRLGPEVMRTSTAGAAALAVLSAAAQRWA
jgi:16S rRNA (uracil1498-N3)-methyltransferase